MLAPLDMDMMNGILPFLKSHRTAISRIAIVLGIIFAMALFYVFRYEIIYGVQAFDAFVKSLGPLGVVLFMGVFILMVPTLIPTIFSAIASGILYGVFWGFLVAQTSMFTGCMLAFFIGRYACGSWLTGNLQKKKYVRALIIASETKGWQLSFILRLSPILPWGILNYVMAILPVRWYTYMWTTFVAMAPHMAVHVWLGHTAGSIVSVANGEGWGATWEHWVYLGVIITLFGASTLVLGFICVRILRNMDVDMKEGDEPEVLPVSSSSDSQQSEDL